MKNRLPDIFSAVNTREWKIWSMSAFFSSVTEHTSWNTTHSGMSFHFYADLQIYLLDCIEEIKACLLLNFLRFNVKMTEVLLFGPRDALQDRLTWGSSGYLKPAAANLGVRLDGNLIVDAQISSVVKSTFFQLRQLSKVKPFLSRHHLKILIHVFVSNRLDLNAL